jgi:RimJ/RimL family protein N-acetyltransferase
MLEVFPDNKDARVFYEKVGFSDFLIEIRKNIWYKTITFSPNILKYND